MTSNTEKSNVQIDFLQTLKNSSLRRFSLATLMWGIGHQLITVSQGYVLFELTDSTLWLAALGAAVGAPTVVIAVLGGMLADRIPRTRMLKIGSLIVGTPMLGIAVLYATDSLEPWHILVAGSAQGSGLALDWIARLSLLPDMVPKNILVRAISIDVQRGTPARPIDWWFLAWLGWTNRILRIDWRTTWCGFPYVPHVPPAHRG
ncbi:MAG: MFS transporter [Chloroflexota bacterium]